MNKRGQFYIIIALLLSFALFTVTYATNTIEEPVSYSNFNEVSENYVFESSNLINYLLSQGGGDIKGKLQEFTVDFLSYARTRDPSFQMIYFYSEDENIYVTNNLDEEVGLEDNQLLGDNQELIQDVSLNVSGVNFVHQVPIKASNFGEDWYTGFSSGPFRLSIGGIIYPLNLNSNDLSVIFRSTSGEDVTVNID